QRHFEPGILQPVSKSSGTGWIQRSGGHRRAWRDRVLLDDSPCVAGDRAQLRSESQGRFDAFYLGRESESPCPIITLPFAQAAAQGGQAREHVAHCRWGAGGLDRNAPMRDSISYVAPKT